MLIDEMVEFLRQKLALMIEHSWSVDHEERLAATWSAALAGIETATVTKRALHRLDRELEKEFETVILEQDHDQVRELLRREFGVTRLSQKVQAGDEPAPAGEDVVVVRPRCPRPEPPREDSSAFGMMVIGPPMVTVTDTTVLELVQIYSDWTRCEVRVPRAFAERGMSGSGAFNPDYVHEAVVCRLEGVELTLEKLSSRVASVREGGPLWESRRMQAAVPEPATEAELAAASAALSDADFWRLVEGAAKTAQGQLYLIGEVLAKSLKRSSPARIMGFQQRMDHYLAKSYTWDLWAVAYIMMGGCSDDSFFYFRGWLVASGRKRFEAAMKKPERAAAGVEPGAICQCEWITHAAHEAYRRKTGRPMPRLQALAPAEPAGTPWDEADLANRFPRLSERFA